VNFSIFLERVVENLCHANGKPVGFSDEEKIRFINAHPFVFMPEGDTEVVVDPSEQVDLPFKCCFFEMFGDKSLTVINEAGREVNVWGVLVEEIEPKKYDILILMADKGDKRKASIYAFQHGYHDSKTESFKAVQKHFLGVVQHLLNRMTKSTFGTSPALGKVRVRTRQGKQFIRPHKFIFVVPKNQRESLQAKVPQNIDWSFRWSVRGHWRSLPNRIGKDREGNPIQNFTWVSDYTKGPEDKPLIEKTRIVK